MRARGPWETSCTVSIGPKTRRQLPSKRIRWYRVSAALKLRLVVSLPHPQLTIVFWYFIPFFFFFFFFFGPCLSQEQNYEGLACGVSQYRRMLLLACLFLLFLLILACL